MRFLPVLLCLLFAACGVKMPVGSPESSCDGNYYRKATFDKIPKLEKKNEMEAAGFKIEEYLGLNTFLIQSKAAPKKSVLSSYGVTAISTLDAKDKLHQSLKSPETYPDWIKRGEDLYLVCVMFTALEKSWVQEKMSSLGGLVISGKEKVYRVKVPANKLVGLSNFPCLKSLEPVPPRDMQDIE